MTKSDDNKSYYRRNREHLLKKQNGYSAAHREAERLRAHKWYHSNKDRAAAVAKRYRENHREVVKARVRKNYIKLKVEVLKHYASNGWPKCVRCGFVDIRALTIDHIDGGGHQRRATEGIGGGLYYWLKRNHFPTGYQTLCQNCQQIKRWENDESGYRFRKKGGISAVSQSELISSGSIGQFQV